MPTPHDMPPVGLDELDFFDDSMTYLIPGSEGMQDFLDLQDEDSFDLGASPIDEFPALALPIAVHPTAEALAAVGGDLSFLKADPGSPSSVISSSSSSSAGMLLEAPNQHLVVPHQPALLTAAAVAGMPDILGSSTGGGPMKRAKRGRNGELEKVPIDPRVMAEEVVKKQKRMMKNRESASLSRQRKKMYMEKLEREIKDHITEKDQLRARVDVLEKENEALRTENERLRAGAGILTTNSSLATKAGACVFVVLFCFAMFGMPSLSSSPKLMPSYPVSAPSAGSFAASATGRTLLSIPSIGHVQQQDERQQQRQQVPSLGASSAIAPVVHHETPVVVEKRRQQEEDLDAWIREHEDRLTARMNESTVAVPRRHRSQRTKAISTDLAVSEDDISFSLDTPVFRMDESLRPFMFKSFQRRADTSYMFCTEVQVVSAVRQPDQGRHRLSLVMPTPQTKPNLLQANATDFVQVDCEVTQYRLVHPFANLTTTEPISV